MKKQVGGVVQIHEKHREFQIEVFAVAADSEASTYTEEEEKIKMKLTHSTQFDLWLIEKYNYIVSMCVCESYGWLVAHKLVFNE